MFDDTESHQQTPRAATQTSSTPGRENGHGAILKSPLRSLLNNLSKLRATEANIADDASDAWVRVVERYQNGKTLGQKEVLDLLVTTNDLVDVAGRADKAERDLKDAKAAFFGQTAAQERAHVAEKKLLTRE